MGNENGLRCAYLCAIFGDRDPLVNSEEFSQMVALEHLGHLSTFADPKICEVLFVANTEDEKLWGKVINLSPNCDSLSKGSAKLEFRPNNGFSYGAWAYGLDLLLENDRLTHAFLIEDDYLPAKQFFVDDFLVKVKPGTGFVAQRTISRLGVAPRHAASSNGLILLDAARDSKRQLGSTFIIFPFHLDKSKYLMGTENQITFLSGLENCGYRIEDLSDTCSIHFFDSPTGEVLEVGNPEGELPLRPWLPAS
jgi:hypothetical protein